MLKIKVIIEGDAFGAGKVAGAMLHGLREQFGKTPWQVEFRREVEGGSRMALVPPTEFLSRAHNIEVKK